MSDGPLFLCIDGGGSKTSIAILDNKGTVISRGLSRSSNHSDAGIEKALENIGTAVRRGLEAIQSKGQGVGGQADMHQFEGIWAALSGIDSAHDERVMRKALGDLFGVRKGEEGKLRVTNDCHLLAAAIPSGKKADDGEMWRDRVEEAEGTATPTLSINGKPPGTGTGRGSGSRGGEKGIVLIAGTGSITMAFQRLPTVSGDSTNLVELGRLGGYGFLLGDEGSAFWVGREAIRRVLVDEDMAKASLKMKGLLKHHCPHSSTSHTANGTANEIVDLTTLPPDPGSLAGLLLKHFNVERIDDLIPAIYAWGSEDQRMLGQHEPASPSSKQPHQHQRNPSTSSEQSSATTAEIRQENERKIKIAEIARLVVAACWPPKSVRSLPYLTLSQVIDTQLATPTPERSLDFGNGQYVIDTEGVAHSVDFGAVSDAVQRLPRLDLEDTGRVARERPDTKEEERDDDAILTPVDKPDRLAREIMRDAAKELSNLVRNICTAYGVYPDDSTLVLGTGLFTVPSFVDLLRLEMQNSWHARWKSVITIGAGEPEVWGGKELVREWLERRS